MAGTYKITELVGTSPTSFAEAVRAAVAWGERHLGSARTVCLIHPENLRSVHVAEKCGYKELERTIYKGQPALIFER